MADRTVSAPLSVTFRSTLVVAVAAIASGFPILFNDFAWDDSYLVLDNPVIRDLSNLPEIFTQPWASGVGYALGDVQNRPYYRPLALLSMMADWAVAGGPNPVVFHATNLTIHTLTAVFLFLWVRKIYFENLALATAIAVVWAVHPVHTEAVALVTYRTTLLVGLFTFLGLWVMTAPRGMTPSWNRIAAGIACFGLGLLSKETMLVFPALVALSDLLFAKGVPIPTLVRSRATRVYLPLALVGAAWWFGRAHVTGSGIYDWFEGLAPWQKALMIPRIFFLYVRLCLLPYPLCPFYDWDILGVPHSILEPDIVAGFVLLFGVVSSVFLLRRRAPEVAFGFAFFLVALLPVSHIVPFFDAAGERFLYVPLLGMLVAVAGLVQLVLRRSGARASRFLPLLSSRGLVGLIVVVLSSLTFIRHTEWRDSETILRAMRRDFPSSVSANLGLGRLLLDEGRYAEAVSPLRDVTERSPRLSVGHGLLAVAQALSGDLRAARATLMRAPLPEPNLPSAVQIARGELLRRGAVDALRRMGL